MRYFTSSAADLAVVVLGLGMRWPSYLVPRWRPRIFGSSKIKAQHSGGDSSSEHAACLGDFGLRLRRAQKTAAAAALLVLRGGKIQRVISRCGGLTWTADMAEKEGILGKFHIGKQRSGLSAGRV